MNVVRGKTVQDHIHPALEKAIAEMKWAVNAMVEYLEAREPGASIELQRNAFYHQCYAVMLSREQSTKRATPENALQASAMHNNAIGELERLAQERKWMDVFNKALRNAKQVARES